MKQIERIARQLVLNVRGAQDVPGFDACVKPAMQDVRSVIHAIEDAGYVVLPVEPTHEMTATIVRVGDNRSQAVKDYKGMIAARPKLLGE